MANKMDKKLLHEFPPITTSQWEAKIQEDLKGADYEKKLVWNTLEGFKVRPYYRSEDLSGKEYLQVLPGEFPYTRGLGTDNNWEIRQDIEVSDLKMANDTALFVLGRGVTALGFSTGCKKGHSKINNVNEFDILLKGLEIQCIGLYFKSGHNTPELVKILHELVVNRKLNPLEIKGAACFDPLGYLTAKGAWGVSEKADFERMKETLAFASGNLPNFRVLAINGHHFTDAGASVVQELAYSLSMASEYLTRLSDVGLEPDLVARHMQLNLGISTNYFMEIAKVRAARHLFGKLFEAYGVQRPIYIHSYTSNFQNTIYDPYVNVLRATTEAMAAVLGGTNALVVKPFDQTFKKPNEISDRIDRNIQIILKEESYFDKIADPSAGSYYIENLTDSLIEQAWKSMLELDAKGGFLKNLKEGVVQKEIEATAAKRVANIATRREVLLGTNQYAALHEEVTAQIDGEILFKANQPEGNEVSPIRKFRAAESFEALRLATEKSGKKPKVFMLTYGNLTFRKARAAFACNFFSCAGYEVIDNLGFDSAEAGVKAAQQAKANIIVVCSHDDEYAAIVPEVKQLVGSKAIVVVAGAPACMDELKVKGIEDFIHVKSNVLETLLGFNKKLGIN